MKRKVIFILLGLMMMGTVMYYYVNNILLPVQINRFIVIRAEDYLKRKVSIGMIHFYPFKGFTFQDIKIFEKDQFEQPIITIDEISFNFLLASILNNKKIIIPSINIKKPQVTVIRHNDKEFNFSDLLTPRVDSPEKNRYAVFLRTLAIEDGTIDYIDRSQEQEIKKSFHVNSFHATVLVTKSIDFSLIALSTSKDSSLEATGNYDITTKEITARLTLHDIDIAELLPLLYKKENFQLKQGIIPSASLNLHLLDNTLEMHGQLDINHFELNFTKNKSLAADIRTKNVYITWANKKLTAQGQMDLLTARIKTSDQQTLEGNIHLQVDQLKFSSKEKMLEGDFSIDHALYTVGPSKILQGMINATDAAFSMRGDNFFVFAHVDIDDAQIDLGDNKKIQGNIETKNSNLVYKDQSLVLQSAIVINNADILWGQDRQISAQISTPNFELTREKDQWTLTGRYLMQNADINLEPLGMFQGNPQFDLNLKYLTGQQKGMDYTLMIELTDGRLSAVDHLDEIQNIRGQITVRPDHAQSEKLDLRTLGMNFQLSGILNDFSALQAEVKITSENVDIETVSAYFPTIKEKANVKLTGLSSIILTYLGSLRSPEEADIRFISILRNASITGERIPEGITQIFGKIDYSRDFVTWEDLQATFRGNPFTFNGKLINFSRPVIDTTIDSDSLSMKTTIHLLRKAFRFQSLKGTYRNSSFDLRGDVHLFDDADADIDLRGNFTLDLKDPLNLSPLLNAQLEGLQPSGTLTGEGLFRGKMKDWRNWQLTFDAHSPLIQLKGYPFRDLTLKYAQRDQAISQFDVNSQIYRGQLSLSAQADLRTDAGLTQMTASLSNLDLAALGKDKNLKNKNLSGKLSLSTQLNGSLQDANTWVGKGTVSAVNGYLWQWKVFKGLSSVLLIPEFKDSIFTDGSANFTVRDSKIWSQNLELKGKRITLKGKGWIDFQKNINFDLTPDFSKIAIIESESLRKGPTSILTQTAGYINIKLTGTLDQPHYKVNTAPVKMLEKTTEIIAEGLGSILEDLF